MNRRDFLKFAGTSTAGVVMVNPLSMYPPLDTSNNSDLTLEARLNRLKFEGELDSKALITKIDEGLEVKSTYERSRRVHPDWDSLIDGILSKTTAFECYGSQTKLQDKDAYIRILRFRRPEGEYAVIQQFDLSNPSGKPPLTQYLCKISDTDHLKVLEVAKADSLLSADYVKAPQNNVMGKIMIEKIYDYESIIIPGKTGHKGVRIWTRNKEEEEYSTYADILAGAIAAQAWQDQQISVSNRTEKWHDPKIRESALIRAGVLDSTVQVTKTDFNYLEHSKTKSPTIIWEERDKLFIRVYESTRIKSDFGTTSSLHSMPTLAFVEYTFNKTKDGVYRIDPHRSGHYGIAVQMEEGKIGRRFTPFHETGKLAEYPAFQCQLLNDSAFYQSMTLKPLHKT